MSANPDIVCFSFSCCVSHRLVPAAAGTTKNYEFGMAENTTIELTGCLLNFGKL